MRTNLLTTLLPPLFSETRCGLYILGVWNECPYYANGDTCELFKRYLFPNFNRTSGRAKICQEKFIYIPQTYK